VIAAAGLLAAQGGLGMATSGTEHVLGEIEWPDLATPGGISPGHSYTGARLPYAWDVFGGESWLDELAYAAVTGQVAPLAYPLPPTANGSGFIDELAWIFVPPPSGRDFWGTDWAAYRRTAADAQILYYPANWPTSCFAKFGWFGLSAAEVADPSSVSPAGIYQAFGVGGRFAGPNDGLLPSGGPVVVPHDAALLASLRPGEALRMWDWLMEHGLFSPLTDVESLMFPAGASCHSDSVRWNELKGSWNLSLQTLGWGRYLAESRGAVPVLWRATTANSLLRQGYHMLAPGGPIAALTPVPAAAPATPAAVPRTSFVADPPLSSGP